MPSKELKEKIQKHLKETSYYDKTPEERLSQHQKCTEQLGKLTHGNYYDGKEYLGY